MLISLKSNSRVSSVDKKDQCFSGDHQEQRLANEKDVDLSSTCFTVWRKSLVFSCKGFTVIGPDGNLVYRVDNYTGRNLDRVILMDGAGLPILTVRRRKKLGIADEWWICQGGIDEDCCSPSPKASSKNTTIQPIYSVKKQIMMNILQSNVSVLAHVYRGTSTSEKSTRHSYAIEGSYAHRSCKMWDESRRVVAEIKKKEAVMGGASFGLEVFLLIVRPGFDSGLAMAIVLLLDQMFS